MKLRSFPLLAPLLLLLVTGIVVQLGGCGGGGGGGTPSSPAPSLEISIENANLVEGLTTEAKIAAVYADNSSADLSDRAQWFSLHPSKASIDLNTGKITALEAGTTTISAVVDGETVSMDLTVESAELIALEISPDNASVAAGTEQQFSATGTFYNTETYLTHDVTDEVSWSSDNSGVVSVADASGSKGLASALSAGSANIGISLNGVSATAPMTVTAATLDRVEISAPQTSVPAGNQLQLTATGIFSDDSKQDLSSQVSWSSADSDIATIDSNGLVSAVAAGSVVLSLNYSGRSATQDINVSSATLTGLEIAPAKPSLIVGATRQLTATAVYSDGARVDVSADTTWISSREATVTVGNTSLNKGVLSAVADGSATVSAYFDNQVATVSVSVTPATLQSLEITPSNPSIAAGTQQLFSVTGHYNDGSTRDLTEEAVWASADTAVAEAGTNAGLFQGVASGSSRITAAVDETTAFTDLSVSAATLTGITLSPATITIAAGNSVQFSATGDFSDASSQDISDSVVWQSSDSAVATIDNSEENTGLLHGLTSGSATVSATLPGTAITQNAPVTVTDATLSSITIQLDAGSMNSGTRQSATATAHFSDSSELDVTDTVTWSSSDSSVADISNAANQSGLISALSAGSTTLTAGLNGVSADIALDVVHNPNAPASISVAATPNVILNDNNDSSSVTFKLLPSESSGAIADGTDVDIEVTTDSTAPATTLTTSNGSVSYTLQTNYAGYVSIKATVAGTNISTTGYVYATPSFTNVVARAGYENLEYDTDNTTLLTNSWVALLVKNLSNRDFSIDQFQVDNGADSSTADGSGISGGTLSGGERHGLKVNVSGATDSGISSTLSLSDQTTGQTFDISVTHTP